MAPYLTHLQLATAEYHEILFGQKPYTAVLTMKGPFQPKPATIVRYSKPDETEAANIAALYEQLQSNASGPPVKMTKTLLMYCASRGWPRPVFEQVAEGVVAITVNNGTHARTVTGMADLSANACEKAAHRQWLALHHADLVQDDQDDHVVTPV